MANHEVARTEWKKSPGDAEANLARMQNEE